MTETERTGTSVFHILVPVQEVDLNTDLGHVLAHVQRGRSWKRYQPGGCVNIQPFKTLCHKNLNALISDFVFIYGTSYCLLKLLAL